jgi:hypothetical protein
VVVRNQRNPTSQPIHLESDADTDKSTIVAASKPPPIPITHHPTEIRPFSPTDSVAYTVLLPHFLVLKKSFMCPEFFLVHLS